MTVGVRCRLSPPAGAAVEKPASATTGFTLRAEPQPELVKFRSVNVETRSMFSHLYEDGRVIIRDYDDDDD
jgi:hypothetical protein